MRSKVIRELLQLLDITIWLNIQSLELLSWCITRAPMIFSAKSAPRIIEFITVVRLFMPEIRGV